MLLHLSWCQQAEEVLGVLVGRELLAARWERGEWGVWSFFGMPLSPLSWDLKSNTFCSMLCTMHTLTGLIAASSIEECILYGSGGEERSYWRDVINFLLKQ